MASPPKTRPAWALDLLERVARPVSEEELARRREAARHVRALRDRAATISPDTTEQYIRETREEHDDSW
ncbi:MAG: hypothetical protein ACR2HN_12320 [Tepidiformaceae bacterium]